MRVPPAPAARRRSLRRRAALLLTAILCAGGAALPAGALAHADEVVEEPVLPGLDVAVDFAVAPSGDAYVAHQDGRIVRYRRAAGSTAAHPMYDLAGTLIYDFPVTRQFDRGLVGITLDSQFESGQRYLYAVITRGSNEWVGNVPGGNPNGIRRTGAVVRIAVPTSGAASTSDLKTIVGADAPADPDSTCRPFMQGQAPAGETDAAPNGVLRRMNGATQTLFADFAERHIYPDGDLSTAADGAYDCIPSDSDTHGMGAIASAPDGTLFFSVGDASSYDINDPASLRAYNLESYAGKIMRVDRNGRGVAGHPFCPGEADTSRICTKVWVRGLRNAFRFSLLPPDSSSGGAPVVAVGDVGNFTRERLTVAHAGDNLGWPCWEGTYWAVAYASPTRTTAVKSAWGGPEFTPASPSNTSCERSTASGNAAAGAVESKGIKHPTLEYSHNQGSEPPVPSNGAAIVAGGRLTTATATDAAVSLPKSWEGSYIFGDYVRGWLYRLASDPSDAANADLDGGLLTPADLGRSSTIVQTDAGPDKPVDALLDLIAQPPPLTPVIDDGEEELLPAFYRLTSRPQADGTVWSMHYGDENAGGLFRIRSVPAVDATIESSTGTCAAAGQTQGSLTLTAADAGSGALYGWDVNGDGLIDSGRTARTTTITAAQLPPYGWVRLVVRRGSDRAMAARYLCSGPPPNVQIVSPESGTQVVLGKPVVVRATRPAGDAAATGIPDSQLRWRATTVHGSSHEHPLFDKSPPFETVDGVQRLQATVTPDPSHELGSYTRVRIVAPGRDGSSVTQTITLQPKPVQLAFGSSPAGASVAIRRDVGESTVVAPGTVELAAGAATMLSAADRWTDAAGKEWRFSRWSDGDTNPARGWTVPDDSGDAPIAEYAEPPTPTPPADATPKVESGPNVPRILPPTALELHTAPLTATAAGSRKTTLAAVLPVGRAVDSGGLTVKLALRDTRCRWWVFSKSAFAKTTARRKSGKLVCSDPKTWKRVTPTWTPTGTLQLSQALGRKLPKGRYALRVRISRGSTVLADRLRSVTVR